MTARTTLDRQAGETAHESPRPPWTFLTNHGHVLVAVARNPNMLVHDIAETVGITQRGTLHILADLERAGYIHRTKLGRRTHYTVEKHEHFRHPFIAHQEIGALLDIFSATQLEETENTPPAFDDIENAQQASPTRQARNG